MYETPNFRQVSDLVRAHVREPWQCFWADVIHELEEKQKVLSIPVLPVTAAFDSWTCGISYMIL